MTADTSSTSATFTPSESITLLRDGREAFPAMLEAIRAAEREVTVEMYWFDGSPVAREFIAALTERAAAGVKVYVIYDAIGSIGSDGRRFEALLAAGGNVMEYNPIAPWRRRFRFTRLSQRDHRKVITVDSRVGFCGGLNLGTPWMNVEHGGGGWRDDVAKITGRPVKTLRTMFFDVWARQGGAAPVDGRKLTRRQRVRQAREELARGSVSAVQVLGHDAWAARRAIRRAYLSKIRQARRVIIVENSYFLPDLVVMRALAQAARRGVEVRVVVPRMGDVPAVTYATRGMFAGMMRRAMHVHEWVGGVMHAKTGLVDDWATTGSFNLDFLSLRYNLEVNVASNDPGFVQAVERSLRKDLEEGCEQVDPARWAERPLWQKIREWTFLLGRTLM